MEALNTNKSKKCSKNSALLQVSLILLWFTAAALSQQTCSRANCASCGTVGPCSQCSKGYTLDKGSCTAMTSRQDEEKDVDVTLLVLGILGGLVLIGICYWIGTCCVKKNSEQNKLKSAGPTHGTNLNTTNNQPPMQQAQLYKDRVL